MTLKLEVCSDTTPLGEEAILAQFSESFLQIGWLLRKVVIDPLKKTLPVEGGLTRRVHRNLMNRKARRKQEKLDRKQNKKTASIICPDINDQNRAKMLRFEDDWRYHFSQGEYAGIYLQGQIRSLQVTGFGSYFSNVGLAFPVRAGNGEKGWVHHSLLEKFDDDSYAEVKKHWMPSQKSRDS